MREYHLPDGTLVPAEMQEKIADDVRDFDRALTPEARSAAALKKIGNELPRIRAVLAGEDVLAKHVERLAVAWEIVALGELGFTPDRIRGTMPTRRLMARYGLLDSNGDPKTV
jgi:hypothetical protein